MPAARPSDALSQSPVRTRLPRSAWSSWRPSCCSRPSEHQALLLPCTQSLAGMPPPSRDVAPGPHWQRWFCGWAGAAAVASVVVISVSLCLVAACPPALLVPVVQDLEVSGLLFSSSFPSSSPATPRTPHLLVWLQCTPGSCGPASPCCSRSQADTHAGRRQEGILPTADTPALPNQVAPTELVPPLPNLLCTELFRRPEPPWGHSC